MRKAFQKYKSVVWFSLLKYLEITITAATTFFVAKKIGPQEMGKSIPMLLYITYANYLALGVNQVVVKNYSRIEGEQATREFISINFQHLVAICILNYGLAYVFLDSKYFFLTACISCGTLARGFFSSYYRAIYRIVVLNKNNLIFSFILLILVKFFVTSWYEYMLYWTISLWFGVLLYLFDDLPFFLKIFKGLFHIPKKDQIVFNFGEGIKLALTGVITTILLTSDRFVINKLGVTLALKGSYQLADNAGTAIYMIMTSAIFYFYPKWIDSIRTSADFRRLFFINMKKFALFLPVLIIVIYIGGKVLALFFFKEFVGLDYMIILSSMEKILVILISICSIFYMALDKEIKYIKSMFPLLLLYLILAVLFIYFIHPPIYVVPLSFSTLLTVEFIRKINYISKENSEIYQ